MEKLEISYCDLTEFPQVLCKLKSLRFLDTSGHNSIKKLPETIENLQNLETLNVSRCGLTEFPEVLCKMKSLRALDIRYGMGGPPKHMLEARGLSWGREAGANQIKNLPGTLEQLKSLETLRLTGDGLKEFPKVLCNLKQLKTLEIRCMQTFNAEIQHLPKRVENFTNLEMLDLSNCGLTEFSEALCKLKSLKVLEIQENKKIQSLPESLGSLTSLQKLNLSLTSITLLPRAIERCKNLEELNISRSKISKFPTVIYKMKILSNVVAEDVWFDVLDEDFIKLWSLKPDILTNGTFQKVTGTLPSEKFVRPPTEIVKHGPDACLRYYRVLNADNAVNCSMLNVTVMGKTGVGKSSLIHSIKEGTSVMVDPSDRTVVVDTLEVKYEDVLLKIADFGGHDIYEITCPLFLKTTKQVAIVAVKLSEYTEINHDELVTKWLTTAVSNMKRGSICIVATQCDLCTKDEVREKKRKLKVKLEAWIEEEISFSRKIRTPRQASASGIWEEKRFYYFQTSSLNMEGIKEVEEFLFLEAKSNRSVLPKRWTNIFKKIDEKTDANFITETQYQTLFRKTTPLYRRILRNEESVQCLQLLHDSGMILWYGEKHENLRKIIFHNALFPVSVLQCLFRHNLAEILQYDYEEFGQHFTTKSQFHVDLTKFTQTGILNPVLLKCLWRKFNFCEEIFNTMVEILTMLELCYIDEQGPESMLRLPWFVQNEDMGFLKNLWSEKLAPKTLQYTLTYCFCHRIPGVLYERFCVRLQRHLQAGAHTRQDRKDAVYIEQNSVQVLVRRQPDECEPCMQIHLRCSIENMLPLQKLCLALHHDMDNLCSEYSGLYIDSYLLCPHCLFAGSARPTKRPITDIAADCKGSLELVPCDPSTPGSIQIPAALIFLRLFGKFPFWVLQ